MELNIQQIMEILPHRPPFAAVFNAQLKQVETREENEKALQETIYKIRQEAMNRRGKELAPTDMAGLQKLIQERRELQKLHISLD